MRKSEAKELIKQVCAAWGAEERQRAADLYEQVLAHVPDEKSSAEKSSAEWWYDAALGHRFLRDWEKAYEPGVRAAARSPRGQGDPAYWNLGIATTIRRDWTTARGACGWARGQRDPRDPLCQICQKKSHSGGCVLAWAFYSVNRPTGRVRESTGVADMGER